MWLEQQQQQNGKEEKQSLYNCGSEKTELAVDVDTSVSGSTNSPNVSKEAECTMEIPSNTSLNSATLAKQEDFRITPRLVICISFLLCCLLLSALDYTGTGNIMSTIAADLHGSASETEWIGNGYALTACVAQLPIAAFSDIFGRRNMLMLTLTFFIVGSIICATAPNMPAMIAGRVIQGIGGAGNLVLPEVVIADVIPLRLRGIFYGLGMLVWFIFSGIAPMIAGAFTEYATWRWFYYLNIILGGPLFLAVPYAIKLQPMEGTLKQRLSKVDSVGAILSITSMTSILIGLGRGDSIPGVTWNSWSVVVPLVLGFAGLAGTAVYEYLAKPPVPMFNVHVYGNLSAIICYLHNVLQGIVNLASIYFLPIFFQGSKNMGELASGAAILPLSFVGPPFGILAGWVINKTGHYQLMNVLFWGISTAGMGVMATVSEHKNVASLVCMQILASIGINALYNTLSITANATNPPQLWTDSTAMMSFCRSVGDAFGVAIGGAIFTSQMKSRLQKLTDQGVAVPDNVSIMSIVTDIRKVTSNAVRDDLIDALSGTMRYIFMIMTIFCAVGFVTSLVQKEYSLDEDFMTKQGIIERNEDEDEEEAT